MRAGVLRAVWARESLEILRNRMLLLSIVVPPVVLTALPLVLVRVMSDSTPRLPATVAAQIVANHPAWADMTLNQVASAFALQQFLVMFLILPGYIPLAIASYSIVGEKQTRSLEAVLATPIRTTELLAGKAIAALVPGVLAAWISYVGVVILAAVLLGSRLAAVIMEPTWLAAVLALGPAVGLVSVTAGLLVSSRVNDPRAAQQIGAVIILPIVGLVVIQTTSSVVLEARDYLILAVIVAAIGAVGIRLGVAIFGRETILTRWK
jgi:ABC-2 type transport system permease protein